MSEPNSKRRRVFQLSTSERQGQLTSLPGFNAAMKAGRVGEYKLQGVLEEIEPLKGSWLYKQKQDGTHAIKLVSLSSTAMARRQTCFRSERRPRL